MKQRNFSFLQNITDDDRIMLSRTLDWAEMSEERYVTKYSFFLDERQCELNEKILASVKFENYLLWGGYENAERKILCVAAPYSDIDKKDFPVVPVTFTYRDEDRLSHRDFLGSLMSLKISRDSVGDILVGTGKTSVFLRDSVVHDVIDNISKIGRTGVKSSVGFDETLVVEREFSEISGTVASLRLDSVISLALKISREKASALIRSGLAEVNHTMADSPKKLICEGDKFSVRGFGKFLFKSVNGATKKDRLHITVCKYI